MNAWELKGLNRRNKRILKKCLKIQGTAGLLGTIGLLSRQAACLSNSIVVKLSTSSLIQLIAFFFPPIQDVACNGQSIGSSLAIICQWIFTLTLVTGVILSISSMGWALFSCLHLEGLKNSVLLAGFSPKRKETIAKKTFHPCFSKFSRPIPDYHQNIPWNEISNFPHVASF